MLGLGFADNARFARLLRDYWSAVGWDYQFYPKSSIFYPVWDPRIDANANQKWFA